MRKFIISLVSSLLLLSSCESPTPTEKAISNGNVGRMEKVLETKFSGYGVFVGTYEHNGKEYLIFVAQNPYDNDIEIVPVD